MRPSWSKNTERSVCFVTHLYFPRDQKSAFHPNIFHNQMISYFWLYFRVRPSPSTAAKVHYKEAQITMTIQIEMSKSTWWVLALQDLPHHHKHHHKPHHQHHHHLGGDPDIGQGKGSSRRGLPLGDVEGPLWGGGSFEQVAPRRWIGWSSSTSHKTFRQPE